MNIETVSEVPNLLFVENFFTEEEQADIWSEIKYLAPRLGGPDETFSASNSQGVLSKSNRGLFINTVYTDPLRYSNIINALEKVYCPDFVDRLAGKCLMYRYLTLKRRISTLLNEYSVGDYYKAHRDGFVISVMVYFMDESIPHTGGDLFFADYNYTKRIHHNDLIIMPSYLTHEVTTVTSENPDFKRYSIVQFVTPV